MRTYIRVLIAVFMTAASTGLGYVLAVMYVIFHTVVLEGGLAGGGHAINSGLDGPAVMLVGAAIGAALGIGAALYFWHHSKPG